MAFVNQAPLFPDQEPANQPPQDKVNSLADPPEQPFEADGHEHELDLDAEASPYTRLSPPETAPSDSKGVADTPHAEVGSDIEVVADLDMDAESSPYTLPPLSDPAISALQPDVTAGQAKSADGTKFGAPHAARASEPHASEPERTLGSTAAWQLDNDLNFDSEESTHPGPVFDGRASESPDYGPLADAPTLHSGPSPRTPLGAAVAEPDPSAPLAPGLPHAHPSLAPTAQHLDAATRPIARPIAGLMPLATRPTSDRKAWGRLRPDTQKDYEYRVHLLYRNASERRTQDPHVPHVVSPLEVVEDLIESVSGPTPRSLSSWRVNRSALLNFLANNRQSSEKFVEAYNLLVAAEGPPKRKVPASSFIDLTSKPFQHPTSRRRQGIPLDDLILLLNTLAAQNTPRSNVGSCVQFWLQAGIGAGPRVVEWPGVAWLDRAQGLLSIPNAKLKAAKPASAAIRSARALGQEVRSVHDIEPNDSDREDFSASRSKRRVVQVAEENALWVDLHLSAMWSYLSSNMAQGLSAEEAFKNYYDRCRNQLLEACKIAFRGKRSYTLRMARSQFAANAKMTATFEEVAEMMGHDVATTTRENYAPRRAGWRSGAQAAKQRQNDRQQQTQSPQNGDPVQLEAADRHVRD